jgi:hypothetical protein
MTWLTKKSLRVLVAAVEGGLLDDLLEEYMSVTGDFTPWWPEVNARLSGVLGCRVDVFRHDPSKRASPVVDAVGERCAVLEKS